MYLRFVLFSKVHVRGNGFHIPELHLSFSCVGDRLWFSPGRGPEKQNQTVTNTKNTIMTESMLLLVFVLYFSCISQTGNSNNKNSNSTRLKLHSLSMSYLSSSWDMVVRKKSGSGFLLSFIQPPLSFLSSHREKKPSELSVWSSNRDEFLKMEGHPQD